MPVSTTASPTALLHRLRKCVVWKRVLWCPAISTRRLSLRYDRVLSTQFGVHAAELIRDEVYGMTVALQGNKIVHNKLSEVAGKTKS